ncbi:MAG: CRTAC1 family protein [Gammaproteobacteria bacterium]|nr:CRTAC1 family protein [Gammaproteobacteria bacterium]
MSTRLPIAVLSSCLIAVPILDFPGDLQAQAGPGTRRMAARLVQLARNADFFPDHPMNSQAVAQLRRRLQAVEDPRRQVSLRLQVALKLLRSGRSRPAIQELTDLQAWVGRQPWQLSGETAAVIRDLLALAWLRLGEQENCIAAHGEHSCFLPVRESGRHRLQRGSRGAIPVLLRLLTDDPGHLGYRWLLNLAHMTLGEHPAEVSPQWVIPADLLASDYDIGHFREVAPQLGVDVTALSGGSILEDFDRDGSLDIMASSWGMRDPLRYFRNNGDGTFSERTRAAGLEGQVGGLNISQADYDNDGFPDVLVLRGAWLQGLGDHPNSLLRNNGDGAFEDVTEAAGLLSYHPTQAAAWADYDNDGHTDLFIGNESTGSHIHPCELYRNNGDGTFSNLAAALGLARAGYVKGVAWGDVDNDGDPDLYLSRMDAGNLLYRNDGPGPSAGESAEGEPPWRFVEVSRQAGVGEPGKSFATWFWDYDNDGWQDLFVAGYSLNPDFSGSLEEAVKAFLGLPHQGESSRLFRNNGDGTFRDVSREAGLEGALLTMGANFGDLDNDGFLDCYLGTGEPDLRTLIPNQMFRNHRGKVFQNVTTSGGFGHLQKGHGVSFGDIDNDGDQDIYTVMGGWYSGDVYQNLLFLNPGHGNRWITLLLEGVKTNRMALGARIKVTVETEEGDREIHSTVSTGGSFGASSLQQEIGLGRATGIKAVEIYWPATGKTQTLSNLSLDGFYRIREGEARAIRLERASFELAPPVQ